MDIITTHCCALLIFIWILSAASGQASPCTTDMTSCSCTVGEGSKYTMSCDREDLDRVPRLTSDVVELHMFRTDLLDKTLGSSSLRLATSLRVISIESCDLMYIESDALSGLYSMTSLNLAYNDLQTLPRLVFSNLNLLQTLDLSYNSLTELHSDIFSGLDNLNTLDLSYNSITDLPSNLLKNLPSLKYLRLENSLDGVSTVPDLFLSYTPQLESLNLDSNKITQLQNTLFDYTPTLRELSLKGNLITTLSAEVFQDSIPQLSTLEMEDNPFVCDCQLISYRSWIDTMSSKSWTLGKTGKCNMPPDLRGEFISTLPLSRLICATTTSTISTIHITSSAHTQSHTSQSPGVVSPTGLAHQHQTEHPAVEPILENKSKESSIIIGCSVGGAFLLITLNILIICCVRKAKLQQNGARRIKYIVKPDFDDKVDNPEDIYSRPFKQPTVDTGNGNSYMISNGSCGFYHTGSRSRLYGTDLEDTIYSTPPKVPPKIDLYCEITTPKLNMKTGETTLSRRESTNLKYTSSVYNVPMDDSYPTEYSTDQGSFYVPQYDDEILQKTPAVHLPPNQQARKQLSYPHLSPKIKHMPTEELHTSLPPSYDSIKLIPECLVDPNRYKKYYGYDNYLDVTSHHQDLAESQEFKTGEFESGEMKHSTGSGADSGVHSYTPTCHDKYDTLRATRKEAPAVQGQRSINRSKSLNSYHTAGSPSQKKVRNETYV